MQAKAPNAAGAAATAKPARSDAQRRLYITMRIEELRDELKRLTEERKALVAKVK